MSASKTKFARSVQRKKRPPYFAIVPGSKIDRLTNIDVPAWSTSLFSCTDNPAMVLCGLTGIGVFIMHGHNQDALTSGGCCISCCIGTMTWGECGRQRRHLRKRYSMSVSPHPTTNLHHFGESLASDLNIRSPYAGWRIYFSGMDRGFL